MTFTKPSSTDMRYTFHTAAAPALTMMPNASARIPAAICVPNNSLRLSNRSASTPPHEPNNSIGRNWNRNSRRP
jgi:hypothetical protein